MAVECYARKLIARCGISAKYRRARENDCAAPACRNSNVRLIRWGRGDCAPRPFHTTGRAVFRIRRLSDVMHVPTTRACLPGLGPCARFPTGIHQSFFRSPSGKGPSEPCPAYRFVALLPQSRASRSWPSRRSSALRSARFSLRHFATRAGADSALALKREASRG